MSSESSPRAAGSGSPPRPPGSSSTVGYGRPPLHSRFTPGKSGNPRGRPKGQLNIETEVREGDRSRRVRKGAAWVVRIVNAPLNNTKANATRALD
jgi:hypothetical protein